MGRKLNRARILLFAGCAVPAIGLAAPVLAQTPDPAPAPASAQGSSPVHEAPGPAQPPATQEVVVTAQRRTEVLEKVPMSVAVVTPAQLQKSGVVSIQGISQLVAGTSVNFAGCCSQPSIRGISTLTTGVGFENNIAIYVDGFYVPDNLSVNSDLTNISSIEVLKGPQGALWGRNATGGAILINTLAPSRHLTGDLELGYGDYNEVVTRAYLAGPLSDRLGFSVAVASRTSDGYNEYIGPTGEKYNDHLTPLRQVSLRTKLEYKVTDWLTATLAYNYADSSDARSSIFQYYNHISPQFCVFQCFNTSQLNQPKGTYQAAEDLQPKTEVALNEGTLKLEASTPFGKLTSATGYAHRSTAVNFDFDESWFPILDSRNSYYQDTFQQSFNYDITRIRNLDLILGMEYLNDVQGEIAGMPTTSVGPSLSQLTSFVYTDQTWSKLSQSAAFYFDGSYNLTDRLHLDVGGRYSHDYINDGAGETGIVATPFIHASDGFSAFTPRASLRYDLQPRTDVYFTYSQGYRNGGFNPVPPLQTTPFQPEKIKSYEVGFKTAKSWIQFDSAFFYYDYTNLQVGVTVFSNGGTTVTNETLNAKAARVYGWDNDITLHPIPHATVRAGLELLHARYTDFTNASGEGVCAVPMVVEGSTTPCTVGTNVAEPQDLDGQRMIRAPDVSGFFGADYEFQNLFGGSLDAATNVTFQTAAPTENASVYGPADPAQANQERYVDPARAVLNATLTWKDMSGHYTVTLWTRNLTDTKYLIVNGGVAGFGDFRAFGEPITGGVRVGYSF